MDEQQKKEFRNSVKAYAIYTTASVLGPLFLFGLLGYSLDSKFGTKPTYTLFFVALAFIFTNISLFKKAKSLSKEIEKDAKVENDLKDK